ncbi:unnamed protein product [Ilex paraguariensis]|uniref:Uncharacterized protein n=1 Tax=Ilex paraguariensis TaxID=185542 RepID=A0ABC8UPF2_9AQUA
MDSCAEVRCFLDGSLAFELLRADEYLWAELSKHQWNENFGGQIWIPYSRAFLLSERRVKIMAMHSSKKVREEDFVEEFVIKGSNGYVPRGDSSVGCDSGRECADFATGVPFVVHVPEYVCCSFFDASDEKVGSCATTANKITGSRASNSGHDCGFSNESCEVDDAPGFARSWGPYSLD